MMSIRFIVVLIVFLSVYYSGEPSDAPEENPRKVYLEVVEVSDCEQSAAEQTALIGLAEKQNFTVRRVEFLGLTYTRDHVVRERMTPFVNEGDLFSRSRLVKSLQNMSKLNRVIYPVRMRDVVLSLKKPEQHVDMLICFKERRR